MTNNKHGKKKNQNTSNSQQPNNTTAPAPAITKLVNCHYIPQWILKQFSKQECSKDGEQKKDEMEVYYYCLESSTLTKRRIKEVYAEGDLFKDPSNPLDVGREIEIERELSKIESSASITVKLIHQAIEDRDRMNNGGEGSTTRPANLFIKRTHLELLHKFMFIMHYHQPSVSTTYFALDNPSNSANFQWIKAYQTRYDLLEGPKHIWLHLLRYYLITPHLEIYESGRRIHEMIYDESAPTGTLPNGDRLREETNSTTKIDPKLEDWKCFGYYLRTQKFLAIWEAARGEEFVMSSNSFGVSEGGTISSGELHSFFVVSPRIVLVLYHPGLPEQEYANGSTDPWKLTPDDTHTSLLLTAPRKRADVKYISDQPPPSHSHFSANPEVFAASPGDDFKFEICSLSPEDTHTVNGIILERLLETGAATFGSRDAALRTLTQFNMNPDFDASHKHKIQSLIQHLSPLGSVQTIRQRYFASRVPLEGFVWANDLELYRLLQEGTDADCIRFRSWEEYYRQLWLVDETPHVLYRPARLVSTMDDILARDTFIALSQVMTTFELDTREERIFDEQLLIALLGYLVNHKRYLVESIEEDLLGPMEGRGGRGIMEYIDDPCVTESAVADQIPTLDINLTMLLEHQLASICYLVFFILRHCLFLILEIFIIAFDFAWVRGRALYWPMVGDRFPLLDANVSPRDIDRGWVWMLMGSWVFVTVVIYILCLVFQWLGPADVSILFLFALQ